jgi:hypothetical protein
VRTSSRRLITVFVLVVWVLLGPIAMTYGGCAGMGAMCMGPCALTSCVLSIAPNIAPLPLVAYLQIQPLECHPTSLLKVPDPPPRSVPNAA